MFCPRCAYEKTTVEGTVKGCQNERFRRCPSCGYAWQTIEIVKYDWYPKFYLKSLFDEEENETKGQS